MPRKIDWDPLRPTLIEMRKKGESLWACSQVIGVSYPTAVREARRLGIHKRIGRGNRKGVDIVAEAAKRGGRAMAALLVCMALAPAAAHAHGDRWRHHGPPPSYYGGGYYVPPPPPRYLVPPPPMRYGPPPVYYQAPPPPPVWQCSQHGWGHQSCYFMSRPGW